MKHLFQLWLCVGFIATVFTSCGFAQDAVEGVRAKKFMLEPEALQYYLIAADGKLTTPEHGYKLLIVMPGGEGSEDFLPFVENIYKNVLDEEYLLVQLVAPKWTEKQKIIWPTARNKVAGQKVSVEDFVKAAVEDVRKRSKI